MAWTGDAGSGMAWLVWQGVAVKDGVVLHVRAMRGQVRQGSCGKVGLVLVLCGLAGLGMAVEVWQGEALMAWQGAAR